MNYKVVLICESYSSVKYVNHKVPQVKCYRVKLFKEKCGFSYWNLFNGVTCRGLMFMQIHR